MKRVVLLGLLVVGLGSGLTAQDAARIDAARMQTKLLTIIERGLVKPGKRAAPQRTAFTDREVNAYFRLHGPDLFPTGVKDAQVAISEAGRVQARAMVALDQALKTKERSWLDPLAWVTGTLEVTAAGTLTAANGKGHFALERATLGGVAIPKSLLQELVSFYSATPTHPKGFDLDQPFELPAKIHSVQTTPGSATVVQQ
jgi:hypothetical protein